MAMAPKVMAAGMDRRSGFHMWRHIMAISTSTAAVTPWNTPITKACFPVFCSDSRRNSVPMEKAMKPMATSESSDSASTLSYGAGTDQEPCGEEGGDVRKIPEVEYTGHEEARKECD